MYGASEPAIASHSQLHGAVAVGRGVSLTNLGPCHTVFTRLILDMEITVHTWQLQEAKNRFSEVVDLTLKEGPQLVTRRGEEAVVILAAKDYRRLSGQATNVVACLLNAPRGEPLVLERSRESIRDLV